MTERNHVAAKNNTLPKVYGCSC